MRYVYIAALSICIFTLTVGCAKKQTVQPTIIEPETTRPAETKPKEPVIAPLNLNRIFFDFDRADIRQDAAVILDENARGLKLHPDKRIVIEGHCCEIGTSEYNFALGERRAKTAYNYLCGLGIQPSRLSIVSYGEEKPLDPSNLSKNRRCEFSSTKKK